MLPNLDCPRNKLVYLFFGEISLRHVIDQFETILLCKNEYEKFI